MKEKDTFGKSKVIPKNVLRFSHSILIKAVISLFQENESANLQKSRLRLSNKCQFEPYRIRWSGQRDKVALGRFIWFRSNMRNPRIFSMTLAPLSNWIIFAPAFERTQFFQERSVQFFVFVNPEISDCCRKRVPREKNWSGSSVG